MFFLFSGKNKIILLLISLFVLLIGVFLLLFSSVIFQEGNPWSQIKGIVQLNLTGKKMVRLSENEDKFLTKSKNGSEVIKSYLQDKGYDFTEQMGSGYLFQSSNGSAIATHKYYSRFYSIWRITENFNSKQQNDSVLNNQQEQVKKVEGIKAIKKEENKTEATIVSVGDIFLHTNNLYAANDPKTKTYNFDSVFSEVSDYLKQADLSIAHLGGVMDPIGPYTGYPVFRSPAALVDTLEKIGLDVAMRTNHTLDFGTKGFNTTSEVLKKHNIKQIAAHPTEEESKKIFIYEKGDLKISFLGYIYGMNGIPIPKSWMINLIDLEKIQKDIIEAKKQSDFVVVNLHFGTEYERQPTKWQKETVQKIADYGADLIVGSHPHVIEPVELITAKDGRKVYVAYSLGNFYCGQRNRYTDEGMILKYTVEKVGQETKLKEISYTPTWVAEYKENGRLQYKVLPSKKYVELYEQGKASFLSKASFDRLKQSYQDVTKHLNNEKIGFVENVN